MNIGDQFKAIIERKAQGFGQVAEEGARLISEESKSNTLSGRGFGDDRYDNTYEPVIRIRKDGSQSVYQRPAPVILRKGRRRIENQTVTVIGGDKAQIRFSDSEAGQIFRYHHQGIDYPKAGKKMRSIFPKKAENVPPNIKSAIHAKAHEVLSK
jgi:hypothetical protein